MTTLLNEMTWPQASKAFSRSGIFFIPVGSTEQHGLHLPLGTDYFQAVEVARRIAVRCKGIVLPGIPFGYSENHMKFKGTITIPGSLLKDVIKAVCQSVFRHGGRRIVLLNSHGGNIPALSLVAQELNGESSQRKVINLFWLQLADQDEEMARFIDQEFGTHADEVETSVMLVFHERLVHMEKSKKEIPPAFLNKKDRGHLRTLLSQGVLRLQELTKTGVLGDPTRATKEKGEAILELVAKKGLEFIQQAFKGVTQK
jgi:creatinine amidohydrolase